ncbi:putative phage protein (TIGR02220 family) [Lactobacillus colini]|uniref:Phage protein (TIGR02220 family) n=1 Tax=Lactobacillus colini TaxID=1819254 RepID=A0ABS4MH37_9LACO|nr:conserved phage C-terminal domain-containing protein [Lactobacillus colini]MBP2058622.1 putative phage protein (TIGR02220 family) [Lactobacillus colini]
MARRRMFSQLVVDTDNFMDLPATAKVLYFYLNMHADDDGFLSNPKTIKRMINASDDDLKILIAKGYILTFDDGAIVIRHWRIHNSIRKDRYSETVFQEDKAQLIIDSNGQYQLAKDVISAKNIEEDRHKTSEKGIDSKQVDQRYTNGQPVVAKRLPQVRLGKVRLSKDKDIYVESNDSDATRPKTKKEKIPYKKIIEYLNDKANRSFNPNTKAYRNLIRARWNDRTDINGHKLTPDEKLAQFKQVIDNKVAEWAGDEKMVNFLRPNTLFAASHFDDYLQPPVTVQNANQRQQRNTLTTGVDWDSYHPESERSAPKMSQEEINAIFRKYGKD